MERIGFGRSLNRSEMKKILGGAQAGGGGGCDVLIFRCCTGDDCGVAFIASPPYRCGDGQITDSECLF